MTQPSKTTQKMIPPKQNPTTQEQKMTKDIDALCGISITAKGNDTAEILVYDQIGANSWTGEGLTAKAFAEKLSSMGKLKNINVRINSPGGSVFDGTAIYNTLKNNPAKVTTIIDGAALSVASIIAMAGDEIRMAKNGYLMIHDPSGVARGGANDMRKMAEMLDTVKASLVTTYAERSKQSPEKIAEMMTAETWMTANEAKDLGFVDSVTESLAVAASFDATNFANAPEGFMSLVNSKPIPKQETKKMENEKPQAATIAEIKAACEGATSEFIIAQIEAQATLAQAITAHAKALAAKLKAETEAHAKQIENAKIAHNQEIEALKAAQAKPGVKPVASGEKIEGEDSDPIAAYEGKLVEAKKSGLPADKAAAKVAKENPELRQAYIEAVNAKRVR
jgi:ATP-dependent Clp endopeptidase proteolytic subunit ClpP